MASDSLKRSVASHTPTEAAVEPARGGPPADTAPVLGVTALAGPVGAPALLAVGTTIGRYIVHERLGSGGMGVVYAALDPELDRKIVLKLLHPGLSGALALTSGRARLLREAQAMARLSHPNVVAVHDVGTFGDEVFVAMDFVDGVTLSQWLREAPRDLAAILRVFHDAGRGLAAAHRAGMVHRDFKPKSVLLPSLPPLRPRNAADSTISGW